ncbi:MAG: hypothetical protein R3190_12855 [Thermoanaerobaculia bacterium]|nr:hypothetical protein [Thermoanaerobaculia bacterium]
MEAAPDRIMVESLVVRAMLEADRGNDASASEFALAALVLLDRNREGELVDEARRVLWRTGKRSFSSTVA